MSNYDTWRTTEPYERDPDTYICPKCSEPSLEFKRTGMVEPRYYPECRECGYSNEPSFD